MALRHHVPADFGDYSPKEKLVVPVMMRDPVTLEFRKGANMREFVRDMQGFPSVKVDAAVGAGKSTRLPKELALEKGVLVFHVVANPLLVRSLYQYVSKLANEDLAAYPALELFSSYDQQVPRSGVFYIGAAAFVGLMLRHGGLSSFKDCVVFLDEAHESDAYTHVVRNLSLLCGAGTLVQASATFSVGDFRPVESDGSIVTREYDGAMLPKAWDLEDFTKPWCYATVKDSMVIFTDSRSEMNMLRSRYNELGILNFSLIANMGEKEYDEAVAAMWSKKGEIVVVMADSSFRSGMTWPTSTIIDTGRVAYYDPEPGSLKKKTRDAFKFELEQAAGRGGRLRDLKTQYYRPAGFPQAVICDLEGVEAEAAAYLYRLLGFKPVRELAGCFMATQDLPGGLRADVALSGVYPLTYYLKHATDAGLVADSQMQGNIGGVKPAGIEVSGTSHERSCSTVSDPESVGSVGTGSVGSDSSRSSLDSGFRTPKLDDVNSVYSADAASFGRLMAQPDGAWKRLVSHLSVPKTPPCEVGNLCELRESIGAIPVRTSAFPDGLGSVLKFLTDGNSRVRVAGLTRTNKAYLVDCLITRYNVCAVEVMAAGQALIAVADRVCIASDYPGVRQYFLDKVSELVAMDAEQTGLYGYLRSIIEADMLRNMDDDDGAVLLRMQQYINEFEQALDSLGKPGASMKQAIRLLLADGLGDAGTFEEGRGSVRFAIQCGQAAIDPGLSVTRGRVGQSR